MQFEHYAFNEGVFSMKRVIRMIIEIILRLIEPLAEVHQGDF